MSKFCAALCTTAEIGHFEDLLAVVQWKAADRESWQEKRILPSLPSCQWGAAWDLGSESVLNKGDKASGSHVQTSLQMPNSSVY